MENKFSTHRDDVTNIHSRNEAFHSSQQKEKRKGMGQGDNVFSLCSLQANEHSPIISLLEEISPVINLVV